LNNEDNNNNNNNNNNNGDDRQTIDIKDNKKLLTEIKLANTRILNNKYIRN
jgi:hypothetical protein